MKLDGDYQHWHKMGHRAKQGFGQIVLFAILTAYIIFAGIANIILPAPLGLVFLAPFLFLIFLFAPALPAVPRRYSRAILYLGVALLPAWPVYLHLKLGPMPIITPTRLVFYALIGVWLYEMACVQWRRKQFFAAARRLWFFFALIVGLFALKVLSIPLAEGSTIAAKETFRQIIIWLLPFFAVLTYVQKRKQLDHIITLLLGAAAVVSLIAIGEFLTHRLLAELFAPLMRDAEWLRIVLEEKSRDGTFRAQSVHTHPLSLGEQLAMMIPLAMYKVYRPGHKKLRLIFFSILTLMILATLVANSRGALIGGVLAVAGTGFLMARQWLARPSALPFRPLAGMVIAAIMLLSPVILAAGYKLTVGESGSKAARSSESRIEQIQYAWPKVMQRPVLGYGTGRSTRILGYYGATLTIDNYYINLALEYGLPGPLIFLFAIGWMGWLGLRWGTTRPDDDMAGLYLALTGVAISFAVTRSILSITTNIELLMLLFAIIIGTAHSLTRHKKINPKEWSHIPPRPQKHFEDHLRRLRERGAPWHHAIKS